MRIPLKRSFGILNGFVKVENTKTVAIWYSHLEACKKNEKEASVGIRREKEKERDGEDG